MPPSDSSEPLDDVADFLKDELTKLKAGAKADIQTFAGDLSTELMRASAAGDEGAVEEVQAQARALAGVNKVRLNEAQWSGFDFAIALGVKLATAALSAA